MLFHLLSDLHLEQGEPFELRAPPGAACLVLAGDVGDPGSAQYRALLARAAELYEHVVLVAGNHECYDRSLRQAHDATRDAAAPHANVHFLNRGTVDVGAARIAGTTLWSDIRDDQARDVSTFIADFRRIRDMSMWKYASEHRADVAWLQDEIARAAADAVPLLVVTHHAPILRASTRPEHIGSKLSSAFETDLSALIRPPVAAWAWGHTHCSRRLERAGVRLLSNQRGYPGERCGFDPAFTFAVAAP